MSRSARPTISYAASVPDLCARLPPAFQRTGTTRQAFDQVRDPLLAAQLRDLDKTEAQRRGEQGQGSGMVKRHRPAPTLRQAHDKPVLRAGFNQDWAAEYRTARMARYRHQSAIQDNPSTDVNQQEFPGRGEWQL